MTDLQNTSRLNASQAADAVASGALLIDVRSEVGRGRSGELKGAVVIAKTDVLDVLSKRLRKTEDGQKIVIFCGSVAGSGPVVEALAETGLTEIYDVDGGFGALVEQGLPLIPRAAPAA